MTVYSGTIEYSGSATHLAGDTRELTAGTNNPLVGQAFGADQVAPSGTTAQGKIAVIDLASGEVVRIDPREMAKTDDADYLTHHASSIKNWGPAARLMWSQHRGELEALAAQAAPLTANVAYTNDVLKALTKLYLGVGNAEEVKTTIQADQGNTEDALRDELGRQLIGVTVSHNLTLYGLDIHVVMQITKFDIAQPQVKALAEIVQARVLGSKASITRVSDRQSELATFEAFKRAVADLVGDSYEFSTDLTDDSLANDGTQVAEAKRDLTVQMKQAMAGEAFWSDLANQAEDYGFDVYNADDFNIASAYNRLWSELQFSGDVTKNGMNEQTMRQYWRQEISAIEVLQQASEVFVKKLQNALVNKFSRYVDVEAYANRALDAASDDLRIKTGEQRASWVAFANQAAQEVLDQYVDGLKSITDLEGLMSQYRAPIHAHSQEIINAIKQRLMAHQEALGEDQGYRNKQVVKALFEKKILNLWSNFNANMMLPVPLIEQLAFVPTQFIQAHEDEVVKQYLTAEAFSEHTAEIANHFIAFLKNGQIVERSLASVAKNVVNYIREEYGTQLKPGLDIPLFVQKVFAAQAPHIDFSYYGSDGAEQFFQEHKDELVAEPAEQENEDLMAQYKVIDNQYIDKITKALVATYNQAVADHPAARARVNDVFQADAVRIANEVVGPQVVARFQTTMEAHKKEQLATDAYENVAFAVASKIIVDDEVKLWANSLPWDEIADRIRSSVAQEAAAKVPAELTSDLVFFLSGKPDRLFLSGDYAVEELVQEFLAAHTEADTASLEELVSAAMDDEAETDLDSSDFINAYRQDLAAYEPALLEYANDQLGNEAAVTVEQVRTVFENTLRPQVAVPNLVDAVTDAMVAKAEEAETDTEDEDSPRHYAIIAVQSGLYELFPSLSADDSDTVIWAANELSGNGNFWGLVDDLCYGWEDPAYRAYINTYGTPSGVDM